MLTPLRFIVNGYKSSSGYTAKFIVQSIDSYSDFTTSTYSINELATGTEDILSENGVTIGSATTFTPVPGTYAYQTVSYIQGPTTTSDMYYQIVTQSLSVVESNTVSITADLPCSFSGSTSIIYSTSSYKSSSVPLWVSIDSITGIIKISAPSVSADTTYSFYVISTVSGVINSIQKLVKLTVSNCQAENCQIWSSSSTFVWTDWNDGYSLRSGAWVKNTASATATSQGLRFTNISIIGSIFVLVALMSLLNLSSMASLWAMINQVQMFLLLLLTRAYIPLDLQNIITGAKFTLNIASYINFQSFGFSGSIFGEFDFGLSDQSLDSLNIKSNSSLFNISPTIILALMIIPIHLLVAILYKLMPKNEPNGRWKWIKRYTKNFINRLFLILTFGWYIRYIFETNQYILISCINEIYNINISEPKNIISLVFAILTICACFGMIVWVFVLSLSSYEVSKETHSNLEEIYNGVDTKKKSKLYVSILLIRRAVFIALLITLASIHSWLMISILSVIQFWYLTYIVLIRPFESKKDNMIEIINETFFQILLGSLIFLNSKENWNSQLTNIYIWIMTSNSFAVFIIIFSKEFGVITLADFIRNLTIIAKNGWLKSTQNGNNT